MKHIRAYSQYITEGDKIMKYGDHEIEMALAQLRAASDIAIELEGMVDSYDELPAWVQSKLTLAADYLNSVYRYMNAPKANEQALNENVRRELKQWIKKNSTELDRLADQDDWDQIYKWIYDEFDIEPNSEQAQEWKQTFNFIF